jgi:FtsX-like permease family protein
MRTHRDGVIFVLAAALALTAMLLAGCGGRADPGAKVEDSLRGYLANVRPEETGFPLGAGVPRVSHNACQDGHVKVPKGKLLSDRVGFHKARFREEVALWSCDVTLGRLVQAATVAVTGSTEVVWAVAVPLEAFAPYADVHVYFCTADRCAKQATRAQERAALSKAQASPLVAKAVLVSKKLAVENFRKLHPQEAAQLHSQTNSFPDALVITPKRVAEARRVAALFGSRPGNGIDLVDHPAG